MRFYDTNRTQNPISLLVQAQRDLEALRSMHTSLHRQVVTEEKSKYPMGLEKLRKRFDAMPAIIARVETEIEMLTSEIAMEIEGDLRNYAELACADRG